MITALIELPVAIPKKDFDELVESYDIDCIPNVRVYESKFGVKTEPIVMREDEFYRDECLVTSDNTYEKDGKEFPSCYVYNRPDKEYVGIKDRYMLVDLENFYSLAPNVSVTVIKAFVTD